MAYFAGYGGVQSFELLYVGLIDFGIGSFLFTGFLVVIGLNRWVRLEETALNFNYLQSESQRGVSNFQYSTDQSHKKKLQVTFSEKGTKITPKLTSKKLKSFISLSIKSQ